MAREMHEMLGDLLLDVAQEWTKYAELEDGRQVRVSWHAEGDREWFEVHHADQGGDLLGRFQARITVTPFTLPEIGPEDDGALRAELSERPEPDHPFEGGYSGMSCVTMMLLADGTGDSCGLPPERHPKPVPAWDPDNPGCAPEACGGSRLDPCSAVMRTKGASHDGEEEPSTWFLVMEGDLVLGGDGKWYEVIRNVPGTGPNWGLRVVTLDLGGVIDKTYNMRPGDAVQRLRGPASRAKQVLADAGLQPEEVHRGR